MRCCFGDVLFCIWGVVVLDVVVLDFLIVFCLY